MAAQHRGVAFRLLAGLAILAVLVVSASVVGILAVTRYQEAFRQTATTDLPNLVSASQLAQLAASLNASAPALVLAETEIARRTAMLRIEDQIAAMKTLIGALPQTESSSDTVGYVAEQGAQLVSNLRTLNDQIGQRIEADIAIQQAMLRLSDLEHGLGEVAGRDAARGSPGFEDWQRADQRVLFLMTVALGATQPAILEKLRGEITAGLAQANGTLTALPPALAETAGPVQRRIGELGESENGALAAKARRLAADQQVRVLMNHNKMLSDEASLLISGVSSGIADQVFQRSTAFIQSSERQSQILIAIAVACIGGVAVVILYINRRVIRRLQALVGCMMEMVNGNRGAAIPAGFADEIGDLGRAFQFFVDTIGAREEALRESERRMATFVDLLPEPTLAIDREGRVQIWNRALEAATGVAAAEIVGKGDFEYSIPFYGERRPILIDIAKLPEDEIRKRYEHINWRNGVATTEAFVPCLRGGDGAYMIATATALTDSRGEYAGAIEVLRDITERRTMEQTLAETTARMNLMMENMPEGVFMCAPDLTVVACNHRVNAMLGVADGCIQAGRSLETSILIAAEAGLYAGDGAEIEARVRGRMDWYASQPDKTISIVYPAAGDRFLKFIRSPTGTFGMVVVFVDITEQVRSEHDLKAARDRAHALLDNSGQGFLSFGADLVVHSECSRACEAMLGLSPVGQAAPEALYEDAAHADLLRSVAAKLWAEENEWKRELMLSLLPGDIRREDRALKAEYKLLENDDVMVVLTDVTDEKRLEDKVRSERQRLEMVVAAVTESRDFFDTVEDFRSFTLFDLPAVLQSVADSQVIVKTIYREIHTFKGLLNQFSFVHTPQALHDLESRLGQLRERGGTLRRAEIADLVQSMPYQTLLDADLRVIRDVLGDGFLENNDRRTLSAAQAFLLERLASRLLAGEVVDTGAPEVRDLLQDLVSLRKVPLKGALTAFDRLIRQTAKRLDKEVRPVVVTGDDVRIEADAYRPFLRSLVHVFRNAVVHGIEDPDSRLAAGKDEAGTILCSVETMAGGFRLGIKDDGAGIDLEALRQRTFTTGYGYFHCGPELSDEELLEMVFEDYISTRSDLTDLAGRGVGLASVRNVVKNLGGTVEVRAELGRGAEFLFSLPAPPHSSMERTSQC